MPAPAPAPARAAQVPAPSPETLPVAVIGAGPVGLAAAAHLLSRGAAPLVLEAGDGPGASVRAWGHVRLFSPWRALVDPAAAALLAASGWATPDPDRLPTGRELVERYLEPLAALPALRDRVRYGARVLSVARRGYDKLKTEGRDGAPFVLRVRAADGSEAEVLARAVIDASGTYTTPNPLGASGVPAAGEAGLADRICYGIPDVLGADRARYAGKRVAVVGAGHSAFNALLDLAVLAAEAPGTAITWIVRRAPQGRLFGGEERDELPARGELGRRVRGLVAAGRVRLIPLRIGALRATPEGIVVAGEDAAGAAATLDPVDELVATTGFRPDLAPLGELRLALDPVLEAPAALAPLIDPNVHSCGTVPPHGAPVLAHPEPGLYVVGMKSYGRAPTFLLLTGYEQVRSVAAALTGDAAGARRVELVLPETGVCSAAGPAGGGCDDDEADRAGPAAPATTDPAAARPAPALAGAGAVCCG
jgi:cation diffusion facilitator CzcD-associated flavoprotein CzcO